MKISFLFLVLMLNICACNQDANDKLPANDTSQNEDATVNSPVAIVVNDTLIRMRFGIADKDAFKTVQHYINGDEQVVCEVNIEKADSIYASVLPVEAGGNIRFSQIIMPDGTADGPFGQTMQYGTPMPGIYKLIIGENKMAGDKWKGNFRIKVWVK